MLNVLDEKWKDHLYDLDQLRNAIHYRSWGQKDPLVEYKQEAYSMFVDLMTDIYHTFTERFLRAQIVFEQQRQAPMPAMVAAHPQFDDFGMLEPAGAGVQSAVDVGPAEPLKRGVAAKPDFQVVGAGRSVATAARPAVSKEWANVGRNDPCPCGSGKKFKKCHGAAL